jgi:hypothetical protein
LLQFWLQIGVYICILIQRISCFRTFLRFIYRSLKWHSHRFSGQHCCGLVEIMGHFIEFGVTTACNFITLLSRKSIHIRLVSKSFKRILDSFVMSDQLRHLIDWIWVGFRLKARQDLKSCLLFILNMLSFCVKWNDFVQIRIILICQKFNHFNWFSFSPFNFTFKSFPVVNLYKAANFFCIIFYLSLVAHNTISCHSTFDQPLGHILPKSCINFWDNRGFKCLFLSLNFLEFQSQIFSSSVPWNLFF